MQTHCHVAEGLSHCSWTSDLIPHPCPPSLPPPPSPRHRPHIYCIHWLQWPGGTLKVIEAIALSLGLPLPSDRRDRRSFRDDQMP